MNGTQKPSLSLYYGEGDTAFGVRRDFVEKNGPKLCEMPWPLKFGVPPITSVEFWGFRVRDDETSLKRIERALQGMGVLLDLGDDRPGDDPRPRKAVR